MYPRLVSVSEILITNRNNLKRKGVISVYRCLSVREVRAVTPGRSMEQKPRSATYCLTQCLLSACLVLAQSP